MTTDAPYKGVMLCERPVSNASKEAAFLPSSAQIEPLGFAPVKKVHAPQTDEKLSTANLNHRKWIKELNTTQRCMREDGEMAAEEALAKREAISNFSEKLRTAVLKGDKVSDFWKAAQQKRGPEQRDSSEAANPASASVQSAAAVPDAKQLLQGLDEFVDSVCMEASASRTKKPAAAAAAAAASEPTGRQSGQDQERRDRVQRAEPSTSDSAAPVPAPPQTPQSQDPAKGASKGKNRGGSARPAWALSQDQAVAVQEDEELDLLSFADNLDFDSFVGKLDDVELQETFKALQEVEGGKEAGPNDNWRKSFVRAINQAAFKQIQGAKGDGRDDDDVSVAGHSDGAASRVTVTTRARAEATAAKLAGRAGGDGEAATAESQWDSSSRCGDAGEAKAAAAASRLRAAEEFLLENPELKGVHSNASVRTLMAKVEQQTVAV